MLSPPSQHSVIHLLAPGDEQVRVGFIIRGVVPQKRIQIRRPALPLGAPPHRGARTGLARIGCDTYRDPAWKEIVCDLVAGSDK